MKLYHILTIWELAEIYPVTSPSRDTHTHHSVTLSHHRDNLSLCVFRPQEETFVTSGNSWTQWEHVQTHNAP